MEQLDGWDILLIAVALLLVGSFVKDVIKAFTKKKRLEKVSDFRYDVTVWIHNGVVEKYFDAVDVDIRDNYVSIEFEDESEIEYEGVTVKVISKPLKPTP